MLWNYKKAGVAGVEWMRGEWEEVIWSSHVGSAGPFVKTSASASSHCGSVVTNPTSIHDDGGSIPGPAALWVKVQHCSWAVVQVENLAQIWHGCRCGIGQQLQLWFDPYPGNFHMPGVWPWKKKKKKTSAFYQRDRSHGSVLSRRGAQHHLGFNMILWPLVGGWILSERRQDDRGGGSCSCPGEWWWRRQLRWDQWIHKVLDLFGW